MEEGLLQVELKGGLCNKLFCLFSACDIAIKNNIKLLEPVFGWNTDILFSDIYDISYFNSVMKKYNGGSDIMIPQADKHKRKYKMMSAPNLWKYSENILKEWISYNKISDLEIYVKIGSTDNSGNSYNNLSSD